MLALLTGLIVAVRALQRNVLRAVLTIAGLQIGVAAVVIVGGLAGGARSFVLVRLESIGTNVISVMPRETVSKRAHVKPLTEGDARAFKREAASIVEVAPVLMIRRPVRFGDRETPTLIYATTSSYLTVREWKMAKGEAWTANEELSKAKVCVLGATVARSLFGAEDPIGRNVRIGDYLFRVSGVLTPKGRDFQGTSDQDDRVLVPIGSARNRLFNVPARAVSQILASTASARAAPKALRQVDEILRQRHHVGAGTPNYNIRSQNQLLNMQRTIFDALTAFLLCVAGMSLLVGGIGVMNIMLVSVTERTREIGIRLAVGASQGNVLFQFLVEAIVLSGIGGALGIGVGLIALTVFEAVLQWPMPVTPDLLLMGAGVSALIGVGFGFAPAYRASRLDPIQALRRE